MTDLIAFLNARLDEDEAAAEAADPGPWESTAPSLWVDAPAAGIIVQTRHFEDAAHIARHDPARVLREVEAKRAIMAEHYPGTTWAGDAPEGLEICAGEEGDGDTWQMAIRWPCPQIRQLAAVYSDHPDYRQEWQPQ